jgi:hypothetical protein
VRQVPDFVDSIKSEQLKQQAAAEAVMWLFIFSLYTTQPQEKAQFMEESCTFVSTFTLLITITGSLLQTLISTELPTDPKQLRVILELVQLVSTVRTSSPQGRTALAQRASPFVKHLISLQRMVSYHIIMF